MGNTTTGDTPTTPNNSPGFITTATDSSGDTNTGPLPNGSQCASDDDCESMNCFSTLGGMVAFCADCNEDQDCVDAGTGTACTLNIATQNAACTAGEVGSTCMSDEACASGPCDAVIEIPIPGLLPDTCGDCGESADCMNMQLCSPTFDFMAFSGNNACVDPGSVENNNLCPKGATAPTSASPATATVVPCPGALVTWIVPLCESMMCFTDASPSPAPPARCAVSSRTR